jgi:hypothetical protein
VGNDVSVYKRRVRVCLCVQVRLFVCSCVRVCVCLCLCACAFVIALLFAPCFPIPDPYFDRVLESAHEGTQSLQSKP